MAPRKIRQARDQPLGGKGGHHRQLQCVAHGAAGGNFQRVALQVVQVPADARGVFAPSIGQLQAPAHAGEQRHAQALLQLRHLPPHRAVRQRQLCRGAGKAAQPCRSLEGLQRAQVGDVVSHGTAREGRLTV
ncbi:hypothetical protein D9M72_442050 [compost metagenome]